MKNKHYVELNATGFRKILKKWDKRSKSTTKELYLARQVDVQPVFDRQASFVAHLQSDCADQLTAYR
jgi:SPX domain protein involved in polyphosphate accumulation